MPEFDALGRDVFAAADSTFESAIAGAVKAVWAAAGFDQGENPNHLWTVSADVQSDRFTVSAVVKDGNVYVPPPAPNIPATVDELSRSAVETADTAPAGDTAVSTDEVAADPQAAAPIEITTAPSADVQVTHIVAPVDVQVTPEPAPTEPDAPAA